MEEIKIGHNRKLIFIIIGIAVLISIISLNILVALCLLIPVGLILLHNSPFKHEWVSKQLVIFKLTKTGIRFYPYETELPWEDIESYHIRYSLFKYYLCIRLKEDRVITDEKQALLESLQEVISLDRAILDRPLEPNLIEYPYDFIEMTTQELKYNLNHFLTKCSGQSTEPLEVKEEIKENPLDMLIIIGIVVVVSSMLYRNLSFFLIAAFIGAILSFNFIMSALVTPIMIFTNKGLELPQRNLKVEWGDIRLVELIKATKYARGALVIWFNDIHSFMERHPRYLEKNDFIIDFDRDKVLKTGQVTINFTAPLIEGSLMTEKCLSYIETYSEGGGKRQEVKKQKNLVQERGSSIEEQQNLLEETQTEQTILTKEKPMEKVQEDESITEFLEEEVQTYELELQKLMNIQFKSDEGSRQMIIIKEEEERCLAMQIQGLRLDGYCIFSKDQIKHISYCHQFYNELLQKEYYFKLKSTYNIELAKWNQILNSYYVKNQFIEVATKEGIYKGKIIDVTEERLDLKVLDLDDRSLTDPISIDQRSILHISFETSELTILKKYPW